MNNAAIAELRKEFARDLSDSALVATIGMCQIYDEHTRPDQRGQDVFVHRATLEAEADRRGLAYDAEAIAATATA